MKRGCSPRRPTRRAPGSTCRSSFSPSSALVPSWGAGSGPGAHCKAASAQQSSNRGTQCQKSVSRIRAAALVSLLAMVFSALPATVLAQHEGHGTTIEDDNNTVIVPDHDQDVFLNAGTRAGVPPQNA